jgi:hypothetical protein
MKLVFRPPWNKEVLPPHSHVAMIESDVASKFYPKSCNTSIVVGNVSHLSGKLPHFRILVQKLGTWIFIFCQERRQWCRIPEVNVPRAEWSCVINITSTPVSKFHGDCGMHIQRKTKSRLPGSQVWTNWRGKRTVSSSTLPPLRPNVTANPYALSWTASWLS